MNRPPSSRGSSGQPMSSGRPGTGQGSGLASSAGRLGTGRLRTGQVPGTPGQAAGYGVSLNTEVQVTDRPVTQQGMMGMRVGTAGPGRQVQDSSFFMGKLHQKTAEITAEIEKLNKEIEQDAKDKSQASQLERKYDTLIREVRQLEGQLADYNLAMDKLRSSTDAADIMDYKEQLHQRNSSESVEVDKIFLLRQEREKLIKEVDHQIQKLYQEQEARMNQLAPMKLNQYKELANENMKLDAMLAPKQQELDMIGHRIRQREMDLSSDQWRAEFIKLEKQLSRIRKERDAAESDAQAAQMNPEDARALMLAKVKDDNAKMADIEKRLKEVSEDTTKMVKIIADLKIDIDERKGEPGESQKYEMLLQRDQEMSSFINGYQERKEKELQQHRETQMTIVALLEHISQGLEREGHMPSQEKFKDLQGDLNFKEKQLQTAQSTKQRLEQELQKRYAELEKINTLDDKISVELSSLTEKIETMTSDMIEFENVDGLKVSAENSRQLLMRLKQKYIRRRDAIKQQVHSLHSKHEKLKNEIAENDTAKALDDLQNKLRRNDENVYLLREFIAKKSAETDYVTTKTECAQILLDVNNAIIKLQAIALKSGATNY